MCACRYIITPCSEREAKSLYTIFGKCKSAPTVRKQRYKTSLQRLKNMWVVYRKTFVAVTGTCRIEQAYTFLLSMDVSTATSLFTCLPTGAQRVLMSQAMGQFVGSRGTTLPENPKRCVTKLSFVTNCYLNTKLSYCTSFFFLQTYRFLL